MIYFFIHDLRTEKEKTGGSWEKEGRSRLAFFFSFGLFVLLNLKKEYNNIININIKKDGDATIRMNI